MLNNNFIKFNIMPFKQPIGELWMCVLPIINLLRMFNIERQTDNTGVERDENMKRINEISYYIENDNATFPTPIILSLTNKLDPEYNEISDCITSATNIEDILESQYSFNFLLNLNENFLFINEKSEKFASVIDGQHRLRGFEKKQEREGGVNNFLLPVVFIIEATLQQQALMFAIINGKQTKVNMSDIYNLYGYINERSPAKVAHTLSQSLNNDPESPFYQKIKMLSSGKGLFSQGTFAKEVEWLIRKGSNYFKKLFNDKKDSRILLIIEVYFQEIRKTWKDDWDEGNTIIKSVGITGFLRGLAYAVDQLKFFQDDNKKIKLNDEYFNKIFLIMQENGMKDQEGNEIAFDKTLAGGVGVNRIKYCIIQAVDKYFKQFN